VVELDEVPIDMKGAQALAKAIRINNELTSLALKDNGLTEKTIKPIAKALQDDEYLNHLSIEHNKIGSEGFNTVIDCI
jgi:Ran GTPase-activating protein (RanGAP) involved in mRNA processing and transport